MTLNLVVLAIELVTAVRDVVKEAYAVVALLEVPPANREKSTDSETKHVSQRASSSPSPNTKRFRVCLESDLRMDTCPFAIKKDQLIAIRETNWKNISSSSLKRPFRPAWKGQRQQDTCRGDQGCGNQGSSGAQVALPKEKLQDNASDTKPLAPNAYVESITGCHRRDLRKSPRPCWGSQDRINQKNHDVVVSRNIAIMKRKTHCFQRWWKV